MKNIINKLFISNNASDDELLKLILSNENDELLCSKASSLREKYYGNRIFARGLIEISSFCRNNCYYCGIRADNPKAQRYRLAPDEILKCCDEGYSLGFRTFVLQGGEDGYYTDDIICSIVYSVKERYPDCAVTLSLGEKKHSSYQRFFDAGADRYLLRHETASSTHYRLLHPENMSSENRKECLFSLKQIGYQVGSGFMVGSPFQTAENIIEDIRFLQQLEPAMIGIGPFISHKSTPFSQFDNGNADLTIRLLSILRLMFPDVLLPATTALGTLIPDGRERGIRAGANVVMPNLSPVSCRKKYDLYENKICTGEESAQCLKCLEKRINSVGCVLSMERGDYAGLK